MIEVSERKPVGSTRTDKDIIDLIGGDDSAPSSAAAPSTGPSTHDLLADIFGSSSDLSGEPASTSTPSSAAPKRSAAADIMSLFDSTPTSPPPSGPPATSTAASGSGSGSLFDLVTPAASAPAPTPAFAPTAAAPQQQAQRQQLQSYPAYDKNGLKITLTPKVSPTQPGVVQILARFTAGQKVEGVNFQVAVPKVSWVSENNPFFERSLLESLDRFSGIDF